MAEYIERERTVELLRSLGNREYRKEKGTIQDAIKMISYPEYTPAADVAPVVHGRWIEKSDPARKRYFECSHCGAQENKHTAIKGYYCWRCGAKMDEKEAVYD